MTKNCWNVRDVLNSRIARCFAYSRPYVRTLQHLDRAGHTMNLIIIRHGLPERIDPGQHDGAMADPGLTDIGHAQAKAMAEWLADEPVDAIYTSPLRRARETATPLAAVHGLDPIVEPGVIELNDGLGGYIPMEELKGNRSAWNKAIANLEDGDHAEFRQTVRTTINRIIDDHPSQTVAIVCHAGVINAWTAELLGIDKTVFFGPEYTAINRFRAATGGRRSLQSLNETAHLRADKLHRMP